VWALRASKFKLAVACRIVVHQRSAYGTKQRANRQAAVTTPVAIAAELHISFFTRRYREREG
jgi:hypothetical protein